MGLFDRIRGDDEEVELRPPAESAERSRETELRAPEEDGDDDDEAFLLPGMEPSGMESDDDAGRDGERDRGRRDRRERSSRGRSGDGREDERLERIIEQNDRIIELLEDVAETGDDADIWG